VHYPYWRLILTCGWNLLSEIRVLSFYLVKLVRKFLKLLLISSCFILFVSKSLRGV
jgi:hypothetical protein